MTMDVIDRQTIRKFAIVIMRYPDFDGENEKITRVYQFHSMLAIRFDEKSILEKK